MRVPRREDPDGGRRPGVWAAILCAALLTSAALAQDTPDVATLASILNEVETRPAGDAPWETSTLDQALSAGFGVRTGAASRAGILYADQTLQRIGENSELEILAPTPERGGFLRILFGKHYFSSRRPEGARRIETPTVVASIRGTEFVIDVARDTTTTITLLEGVVEASNSFGSVTVFTGEEATIEPGKAPVKRIVLRPRDAVSWALYYPAVLGGADSRRLQQAGASGEALGRAAKLLSAGQVDQAQPLIDGALRDRPDDAVALALSSVVHLAANRKPEARAAAEAATAADPESAAAALALSFVAQAEFDIARARDQAERAARLSPDDALALARAAELSMAQGDLVQAEASARAAVDRNPRESRALSVLGFVMLARLRTAEADGHFQSAVAADSESSTARLGLGLARIRLGRVDQGRAELQLAAALDPGNSLLRSYLGKAYYEQRRNADAAKELAAARELDPADPTPYLYDAIRKQNANRPVEALADIRDSIRRNDNRAVYRSRLLLDEDRAVRGADLARIFNDLGFNQLGVVTARRGADDDQSNASSHHLLAGSYRSLPDFAPAFFSELLQARIYQPVSVNAARPDAVNESASFNEYTSLFDRPRKRLFASATYGEIDSAANLPPALQLEDANLAAGDLIATVGGDRYAAALAVSRSTTDGFRVNNDDDNTTYRAFLQVAPTHRDSLQLNILVGDRETGDLPLRLLPAINSQERIDTDLRNIGLGYHRRTSPASDLAVSAIFSETEQTVSGTTRATLAGPQLEIQQVLRKGKQSWVLGAGAFQGDVKLTGAGRIESRDEFANAYGYLRLRPARWVDLTLGASLERVVAPVGILTPRDAGYIPSGVTVSDTRLSPKVGAAFYPAPGTTIRAAAYQRLSPAIGRIQTLEPTQVASFNQFYFDPGGTRSRSFGLGVDQAFGQRVFAGVSLVRRELTIPEASCASPSTFTGCRNRVVTRAIQRNSDDTLGAAYVNVVLSTRLAAAVDYSYDERDFDLVKVDNAGNFVDGLRTHRARPRLSLFLRNGLFASASAHYIDQRVDRISTFMSRRDLRNDFWLFDAELGYKLPRRFGTVLLRGRNLTGRDFPFYERAIEEDIVPARSISVRVVMTL